MKIQIVSDLHLEFGDIEIKNGGADVLVLSGDICVSEDLHDHPAEAYGGLIKLGKRQEAAKQYRDFFERVSHEFNHVVYVAGNHEHYHGKWSRTHDTLAEETSKYHNIHYLERGVFRYEDVIFIGGTLWTDMNNHDPITLHAIRDMMNDFKVIRDDTRGYTALKPATVALRHRETLQYIRHMTRELGPDSKVVVVTHHAPTFMSVHDDYKHETIMNGAYASDLSEFILDRPQIKLWTHGHMHNPCDYEVGTTRVVCNPRGYVGYSEALSFNANKVVEI